MATTIVVDSNLVRNINVTSLENGINKTDMQFINRSDKRPNYFPINYYIYLPSDEYPNASNILDIGIYLDNGRGIVKIIHTDKFPESELDEHKDFVKEKVNYVTNICNITIDWSEVKWEYSYASSFLRIEINAGWGGC